MVSLGTHVELIVSPWASLTLCAASFVRKEQ